MSGRKGSVHYTIEVKREAVRLVEEEHQSYGEVAKHLEIRRAERIKRWVAMYRKEGELSFHKPKGRPRKGEAEQSELKRLRMENALLKNSIPNCGKCSSRSAISDDLPPQRRLRSESDVRDAGCFASRLLQVGKEIGTTRPGCRAPGGSPGCL